ncbi:MAG: hypothetical protein EB060_10620 [Proteobacteria bacterium]|nr:hypothetical protein [Pseudomonadota bacterium]
MAYHLVTRWRDRVEDLAQADAVGCFPIGPPLPHYSGNFWWARGSHLTKLPQPAPMAYGRPGGDHPRLWAELWLQSVSGRFECCYENQPDLDTAFLTGQYRQPALKSS